MKTKICKDCHIEKTINEFRKNSKQCKKCEAISKKSYYIKTKKHKLQYTKEYMEQNKEYYKKYREEHKIKMKQYNQEYYKKNKQKIIEKSIEYEKKRTNEDNLYKVKKQIRRMIYNSFYRLKYDKKRKTEIITGININGLIKHLLKTYKNNYGVEWNGVEKIHIDHIIPLSKAKNENEIIELCHYTNLQLLKAQDNLKKYNKLNWEL